MLDNDPPTGTKVRFVRQIKKAKVGDRATLIRPLRRYLIENPHDEFEIEFNGEQFVVLRQDIEKSN